MKVAHSHPNRALPDQRKGAADRRLTERLRQALALVEIRLLDRHVVRVGDGATVSFAERGWI